MGLHIITDRFVEELSERLFTQLPYDVELELLPRRLYLYTEIPIRADWLREIFFDVACVVLPETAEGILTGTLDGTLRGTLHETLCETVRETPRYLKFYQKTNFGERGERYLVIIYLDKLIALINKTVKRGKTAYILQRLKDEKRSGAQYVSLNSIKAMMGFIDSCSTREALDIKARLLAQKVIRNNGRVRTHGSEIVLKIS
jgi:hypothetical protein